MVRLVGVQTTRFQKKLALLIFEYEKRTAELFAKKRVGQFRATRTVPGITAVVLPPGIVK